MMDKIIFGSLAGIISGILMGIANSVTNVLNISNYYAIEVAVGIFSRGLYSPSISWLIVCWIAHLTIAMAYGVILCYIFYNTGKDYGLVKGLLYGGIVWLLNLGIIAPIIGYRVIQDLSSVDLLFSFVLHLFFGIIAAWVLIRVWEPRRQRI